MPFSANAVLTEYYDLHKRGNDEYLVQTQIVEDPKYLNAPWVVSSHYRREPDGSKVGLPQSCSCPKPVEVWHTRRACRVSHSCERIDQTERVRVRPAREWSAPCSQQSVDGQL